MFISRLKNWKNLISSSHGPCTVFKGNEVDLYLLVCTEIQDTLSEESRVRTSVSSVFLRKDKW